MATLQCDDCGATIEYEDGAYWATCETCDRRVQIRSGAS
jgi:Zn finger protein HypA/HybF involved in hydrogenase expression